MLEKIPSFNKETTKPCYSKVKRVSGSQFQVKDSPRVSVPSLGHSPMSSMTSYGYSYDLSDKLWTQSQ